MRKMLFVLENEISKYGKTSCTCRCTKYLLHDEAILWLQF